MTQEQNVMPTTRGEMQAAIRECWEQALGHADFGDDDAFLLIHGANSLTAVQVMVALSGRLGTRLPVRLIMRHTTVRALADAVLEQERA
ncbi:acyl carrier protein [Streptomyces anulatus]|uniref:acyl carrier protein n=1 Tax=Streptomyces TaxID=1883 RepID=UPI000BEFA462|nr:MULTISPECIES: acyl carrier protein [Streptomyces]UPT46628.1 acyl carrier protein [Streptomyces sp. WAC00303]WIY80748.1 acyl carrier protein [Streptomyces anulatus]WSV79594.1 acyl carrier protein [Streptomyces anulatus]WTF59644.1 acyl carrier protein [Streptomyces anulatus]